jgi:PAS domain S-box-containing protein
MDITDELATQLLNAAPDPTVIVDQRGTIIYANARVSEVLGYTNQELVGEVIEVLIPERARAGHPQHRENFFGHPKARAMGDTLELQSETSPCKKKLHNSWSKRTEQRVDSWRQPAMTCVSQFRH